MTMNKLIKTVAAIHDLSGSGRGSLTTVIPILSTMGVRVCPMPTAILSATTEFEHYSFLDLTDYLPEYISNWEKNHITFDCIYSGFLGSSKQIEIVSNFIDTFKKEDTLVVIDPVLGDNGTLYETMDEQMVCLMKTLIKQAHIITPNFTEARYLLGESCNRNSSNKISFFEIKERLTELSDMGPEIVVITGVPDEDDRKTNTVAYDKKTNRFWKVSCQYIPASFPGTGDAYTSVMIGSLLQGDSLPIVLERGVQFITQCIRTSYGFHYPHIEGVLLEKVLHLLNLPIISENYEEM